ncbi:MAG TPA: glycosyltransferase [Tepidisphaeraceae bacterium]|nr:glycosyltransferase [Tepidisphaeraceae bacterium]
MQSLSQIVPGTIEPVERSSATGSCAIRPMFVVGRLNDEASGVTRIICDLANTMSSLGMPVELYGADCPGMPSAPHLLQSPSRYIGEQGTWLGGLCRSKSLRETIGRNIRNCDIVHNHSMWMLPNHYASTSAHRNQRPVLFTAHGIFESWALARSAWKKAIVGHWWQNRDLNHADCIHVNSRSEMAGVRRFGLCNPIAVVPNGVICSPIDRFVAQGNMVSKLPQLAGKRTLLFLSRLHPKKGLFNLLSAWKRIIEDHDDWHLLMAGPDDGAGTAARGQIQSLGIGQSATLAGTLKGQEKWSAFSMAEAFVLPSYSEGFSMAVLEAMSVGLPVLITPGCNFPEAVRAGAALEIEPTMGGVEAGLRTLLTMSDEERAAMGRRGRKLIETRYTWQAVAKQMIQLYRWLIGGGSAPGFVER